MNIFAISGLINGIVATSFGLLVISKNWRERSNQIYFLMTAALAVWSFGYWQWQVATDYQTALFWVRTLSVGSLFIPVLFFHWVTFFFDRKKINSVILAISYVSIAGILFFVGSPLFIHGLQHESIFSFWPIAGRVYDIYFSYLYIGIILYTSYLLCRSYFLEKNKEKKGQILYIILGGALGFGGGLSNFPLWFGIIFLPYGNFLVATFPLLLGYSVLKYKLFNAKTIATEVLVFFIALVLLVEMTLSTSVSEAIIKGIIFVIVSIFGYVLIQSVYREITQREKIEKLATDLETANVRLTELDRQKSEFVSFATHQLRAPLTAMKGYASMILEGDMGTMSEEARLGVSRIYDSTKTLTTIVDDYLNLTRIELGTMKYAFETIDMKLLIEDVLGEIKPNIEKSGLKFTFNAENNDTDYRITADRDKFKQVIENLIDNSMKYTPKGEVALSLSFDHAKNKIVFVIKDTGIGIAPEILPHLFIKWSRANNANKTNIKGTGLGLFVAKEIITAHHGTIRAESEGEGKGSSFIVEMEPWGKM